MGACCGKKQIVVEPTGNAPGKEPQPWHDGSKCVPISLCSSMDANRDPKFLQSCYRSGVSATAIRNCVRDG